MQARHETPSARPVVSAGAVAPLPRWPLWLMCLAYLLPGFVGRDPWTGDGVAFGAMWQLAQGRTEWLQPAIGTHPLGGGGWLTYWLGAWSIRALGPWLGDVMASRLPSMAMLSLTLWATWWAAYLLTRRDAAQPVQPAFAPPIPVRGYARAIADGALLSLVACVGLLATGHEAVPEVTQMAGSALALLGLALLPTRPLRAAVALAAALGLLATSGAPWFALALAAAAALLLRNPAAAGRRRAPAAALAAGAALAVAALVYTGGHVAGRWGGALGLTHFLGTCAWFLWPAWPLAGWALWRWRESLGEWHVRVPATLLALGLGAALTTLRDPTLVVPLPAAAVLAALALPVMKRVSLAALDWFSLMFFSLLALVVWVLWLAMLTGVPATPAANIARLAPGFDARFAWLPALLALLATAAWGAVVAWRAGRHRHPLWKGMVLSAGGVTLVWVLVGTLWLPVLDYASTYRTLGRGIGAALGPDTGGEPVRTLGLSAAQRALLDYWSGAHLEPRTPRQPSRYLLVLSRHGHALPRPPADWSAAPVLIWSGHRPGEDQELFALYRQP